MTLKEKAISVHSFIAICWECQGTVNGESGMEWPCTAN